MNISNECFNGAKLYIFSQTSGLFTYFYIRRQNSWISVKPFFIKLPLLWDKEGTLGIRCHD